MDALVYFLFWAALIFVMMRLGCGAHVMGHGGRGARAGRSQDASDALRWIPPETEVDPVCGREIRTAAAKSAVHDGTVYYFCSRECRERFEATPDSYLTAEAANEPKLVEQSDG
ncbi:YHS domain-containing protein [Microbaculum marinisediminis]|uniref:YHS domain-containing protein n=1 Tax=Microbaculum marinisediminis TaxID=2931392 RepID=A0AAW5QY09_9HYPH|nr:YHS domain-containing protein [Microbaculum sp. A6E488]MCT8971847.1 YHS domain-containing protein [Microbaculum sp. A6E488]